MKSHKNCNNSPQLFSILLAMLINGARTKMSEAFRYKCVWVWGGRGGKLKYQIKRNKIRLKYEINTQQESMFSWSLFLNPLPHSVFPISCLKLFPSYNITDCLFLTTILNVLNAALHISVATALCTYYQNNKMFIHYV